MSPQRKSIDLRVYVDEEVIAEQLADPIADLDGVQSVYLLQNDGFGRLVEDERPIA